MKQIELVVQNKTGLHARPAKVLVNLAKQFKSDISLQHKGKRANAKSMVSVLTLGAVNGSDIIVQANGVTAACANGMGTTWIQMTVSPPEGTGQKLSTIDNLSP